MPVGQRVVQIARGTRDRPPRRRPCSGAPSSASSSRCASPHARDVEQPLGGPPEHVGVPRPAAPPTPRTRTASPVHAFHSVAEIEPHGIAPAARASSSAASPITSTASCGSPASAVQVAASARAVAKRGATPHRCRQSSSSSSTDVRDDAVSSTVRPSSSSTGRREKSATLCTGPSQVIARSGSR